jgi:SHS2 domain-containing protein
MKQWWTFEHTADMGLEARADTLRELFEALGEGLAEVICPREQVAAGQTRRLELAAEDLEALAVDFLSAVLNVIQAQRFMVCGVSVAQASQGSVKAELSGEPFDPAGHEILREVKAITYHQLKIAPEGDHWTGRVILDV